MKHLAKWIVLMLVFCLMILGCSAAEEPQERVSFLLLCNEGMRNDGGNSGNTMMAISFDPQSGQIRLLMFTWDTFIELEGYDVPQLLDQPYRQNGPEATMKAFNQNFGQEIELFMSLNYLNLANLIDNYDGVNVEVSRAERNALNGMVAAKKENIKTMAEIGILEQMIVESLAREYYLEDWGEDTHLNGLQAVGYGWLQYDSVYNCCLREGKIISDLFNSVSESIHSQAVFYTNDTEKPKKANGRRVINLDDPTEEDLEFLYKMVQPIFDKSFHNLQKEDIIRISLTLGRAAYMAARQGVDVFANVECMILPLEANDEYDIVAGREGHLVDYEANGAAITEFLYGE